MARYALVRQTENTKLGPVSVLRAGFDTCSKVCKLKNNCFCYARSGRLSFCQPKKDGDTWNQVVGKIQKLPDRQLIRLFDMGDLPGNGVTLDRSKCASLASSCDGLNAWGYTRYPVIPMQSDGMPDRIRQKVHDSTAHNREVLSEMRVLGGVIMRPSLLPWELIPFLESSSNIPCSVVLPTDVYHTLDGIDLGKSHGQIVLCEEQENVSATCLHCALFHGGESLCSKADVRVIGFKAHGILKEKMDAWLWENSEGAEWMKKGP
jgi:hypothetical protein